MSAPANDLFANAIAMTANDWYSGSNVGATRETGEPVSNGLTIWWKFTCQQTGRYVVSTRTADAIYVANQYNITPPVQLPLEGTQVPSPIWTNFYSKVQVFTGASVGALTEVPYDLVFDGNTCPTGEQHAYACSPSEYGDLVAFDAVYNTTYYIRVDSRRNNSANTGNVVLSLYGCACAGECTVTPSVGQANVVNFGTFPPGIYTIYYCTGGAFNVISGGTPYASLNWPSLTPGQPPPPPQDKFGNITGYYVIYNGGNACQGFNTPSKFYATLKAAAADAQGASVTINHTGGTIGVEFVDGYYFDNGTVTGYPPPSFYLTGGNNGASTACPKNLTVQTCQMVCDGNQLALQIILFCPETLYIPTPIQANFTNVGGMSLPASATAWPQYSANGFIFYEFNIIFNLVPDADPQPPAQPGQTTQIAATINFAIPSTPGGAQGQNCLTYNFQQPITFGLEANGASFEQNNGLIAGTFNVEMQSTTGCLALYDCTVTLQGTGGVVSPSAPLKGINFSEGQNTPLNFNFQSALEGNVPIVATIIIVSSTGQFLGKFNYSIGTNIVVSGTAGGVQSCRFPVGSFFRSANITVQNLGSISSYNVVLNGNGGCDVAGFLDFGSIPAGGSITLSNQFISAATDTFTVTEIAPDGTVTNFPNFTL